MVGIFNKKSSANIVTLFILSVLIKAPTLFKSSPTILQAGDGIVYKKLVSVFAPVASFFPPVYNLIAFLLIFIEAVILTNFISGYRLMPKPNFLAGMAFILITSFLPDFNYLSAPLVTSFVLLIVFTQLFLAHSEKISKHHIFNSGLLLGLSSMIFFPSVIFIIFGWIALALLRPFRLNEWVLFFVGFTAPYYFVAGYMFLTDDYNWTKLLPIVTAGIPHSQHTIWLAGCLFLVLMPLLVGVYYVQTLSARMLIHIRRAWMLFGFYILFGVLMIFFNSGAGMENFLIVFAPVAAFQGYGYYSAEWRPFALICFWMTVVFILSFQFWG